LSDSETRIETTGNMKQNIFLKRAGFDTADERRLLNQRGYFLFK
jgi:hypothetical protein